MRALGAPTLLSFASFAALVACEPAPIGDYGQNVTVKHHGSDGGSSGSADEGGVAKGSFKLTVTITGSGTGSVLSNPSGITCQDKTCTGTFSAGATVGIVPAPGAGAAFVGWSGSCNGNGTCTPTMNGDVTVGAQFETIAGTYVGSYTHNSQAQGCTFSSKGTLTVTIAADGTSFSTTGAINGIQLRDSAGCTEITSTATGTSPKETMTFNGAAATGTLTFAIQGFNKTLALPYNATLSGNTLAGTWTCPTCTGNFSLTKQ